MTDEHNTNVCNGLSSRRQNEVNSRGVTDEESKLRRSKSLGNNESERRESKSAERAVVPPAVGDDVKSESERYNRPSSARNDWVGFLVEKTRETNATACRGYKRSGGRRKSNHTRVLAIAESEDVNSKINVTKSRAAPLVSKSQRPSRSSRSSRSSNRSEAEKADDEAVRSNEELEKLRAQLRAEQEQRLKAERNVAEQDLELKQLRKRIQNPEDTYPFSFWPPPPWHAEPDITVSPPYKWDREHEAPKQGEMNRHEGKRQFSRRKRDHENAKAENRMAFLAQALHRWNSTDDHTWHGVQVLGSGSYGTAGLWVQVDDDNNIVDRIVAKESCISKSCWEHPIEWRKRLPREVYNHRLLDSTRSGVSHRSIIRHRGYRLMMIQRRYRLYLDLCTGGSLDSAVWDRIGFGSMQHQGAITPLPEAFIWHVFKELMDACIICQQGDKDMAQAHWKPMCHNDIHLANVFVDEQRPEDGWTDVTRPRIILADYGRMFYELNTAANAQPHERDNPRYYRLPADDPRYPYEVWFNCRENWKISDKTDIWMIGAILWCLMSHVYSENGPMLDSGVPVSRARFDRKDILQGTGFPYQDHYSELLKDTVAECLAFDPAERPGLLDLQEDFDTIDVDTWIDENFLDPRLIGPNTLAYFAMGKKHRPF